MFIKENSKINIEMYLKKITTQSTNDEMKNVKYDFT